ncbi:sulfatase [Haloferula chungangensis]|uniref:Sulfatase n=1 Tax=Haloferula chungangensis TaxID=1048331 RepID=A0ABW2L3C0_9BACT
MKRPTLLLLFTLCLSGMSAADARPNILLISIDDLNDWVGCLAGHPQARTPNIDALAERGVLFSNAHCQAPVCNPSRASLMTSLYPETSGIYFLDPEISASPVAKSAITLPKRFAKEGYHVSGAGKLFHNTENKRYIDSYAGSFGGFGPMPEKKISQPHGHLLWDWGSFPDTDETMPDHKIANWAAKQLAQLGTDEPFLLAVGFYRPHVPMFVPQKWYDLHPVDEIQLPKIKEDELADLSDYAINITRLEHVAPTQEWIESSDEWKHAVQSYLACISFVDSCVGTVIKALDESPHKDNTIIALFSDHGFHLGEKERWAKRSLWEDGTRVPVIIAGPDIAGGQVSGKPVGLIDLYPTLLDLTGSAPDPVHEGHSLAPLLRNPESEWPHFTRTSFGPGNVAIRSERFRYIHYFDGSEEFYDHRKDPNEWNNLARNPEYQASKQRLASQLPKNFAPLLGADSTGHLSYASSNAAIGRAPEDEEGD